MCHEEVEHAPRLEDLSDGYEQMPVRTDPRPRSVPVAEMTDDHDGTLTSRDRAEEAVLRRAPKTIEEEGLVLADQREGLEPVARVRLVCLDDEPVEFRRVDR